MIVTHRVWFRDHQAIRNMEELGWAWDGTPPRKIPGGMYFVLWIDDGQPPRAPDRYWREFNSP